MQLNQQQPAVKKVTEAGLLLLIKESYLLFKNSFGLLVHPFKTLRHLSLEKDRSQQLLLLGWPVYVFGVGLLGVYLGRKLLGTSVEWGMAARLSFISVIGITLLVGLYIGYWIFRVGSVTGRDESANGLDERLR